MLPYEASTHVPLLIRGPGLPPGRVSGELVANTDLAPTLLDIAGAEAGKTVDGRSLLPFARNPERRTRRAILHETGGSRFASLRDQDEVPNRGCALRRVMTYRAVRTPGWLYVRYRSGETRSTTSAGTPRRCAPGTAITRYRAARRVLARQLRRLVRCRGKQCRRATPRIPRPR